VTAFLFYVFSILAVAGAVVLVLHRNPVYSALSLIVTMFSLAALFAMQNAQFLAVLQVLLYAGAIMVLFLFVVMLINIRTETRSLRRFTGQTGVALALASLFLVEVIQLGLTAPRFLAGPVTGLGPAELGRAQTLASALFTKYLLPFELASILLFVAIIGGVYFAKRRLP
jgi:NADH-quinone oxidoreductase subunit J